MILFWKKKPTDYFAQFSPENIHWFAVTISTIHYLDYMPNMQLEAHANDKILRSSWGLKQNKSRWDIWLGESHKAGREGAFNKKDLAPFFFYTHLAIAASLDRLKEHALISSSGVTTPEITQEGKALQWIQASFKVLTGALEKCETDHSKLVQASVFIGKKDDKSLPLFRAVIFNLDITAGFDSEGSLGVVIFDDKNQGMGSSRTPALEARFKGLKPPVLDEFIRLTESLMKACESRYI